jgi:hypothetical protein
MFPAELINNNINNKIKGSEERELREYKIHYMLIWNFT